MYLEQENKGLKCQVAELISETQEIKDQNEHLKSLLMKNNIQFEDNTNEDDKNNLTFVTQGSENPTTKCENCLKEIDKNKMRLHMAYCLKNIKKCRHCNIPCDGEIAYEAHIQNLKGNYSKICSAIEQCDLKLLTTIQQHLSKTETFLDYFDNSQENTPIHYCVMTQVETNIDACQNLLDLFILHDVDINK